MWEMIQNICTGIVGVEVFIMVWAFASMYLDERRERRHKQDKTPTHTRICCTIPGDGMCIHDDEWDGNCCCCPVKLSYDEKREDERLRETLKHTVKEIMNEEEN